MSRLYGSVQGDERSEATRTAHRTITAHPRGWDVGVKVRGYAADGVDAFDIEITGGSHDARIPVVVGTVEGSGGSVRLTLSSRFGGGTYELTPVGDVEADRS